MFMLIGGNNNSSVSVCSQILVPNLSVHEYLFHGQGLHLYNVCMHRKKKLIDAGRQKRDNIDLVALA